MRLTQAQTRLRLWAGVSLFITATLALSGCHPADPESQNTVETPKNPPTVAPPAQVAPIVLPECGAINAAASAQQAAFLAEFGEERITASYGETDRALLTEFTGPAALAAADASLQARSCNWVIYFDSVYLYQFTAELPDDALESLLADFRGADFTESERGPATVFSRALQTGDMRGTMDITHTFLGNVWIALIENAAASYEQSAADTLLAANPELADSLVTSCVDRDAGEVITAGAARIAPPALSGEHGHAVGWDTARAIALAKGTFDACSPLSWALLPSTDSASTETQVMLFHFGDFIGTDTQFGVRFPPSIERISKYAVRAEYRWLRDTDSATTPTGKSVSTFTWDNESNAVLHEGEFPPAPDGIES